MCAISRSASATMAIGMPDIDISSPDSLGLRLVKTLVAQLGAEMQLDSSAGTTFTVERL